MAQQSRTQHLSDQLKADFNELCSVSPNAVQQSKPKSTDMTSNSVNSLTSMRLKQDSLPSDVLDAVVKVHAYIRKPNYELPWQMSQEIMIKSTAFAISGRRLLTVSHGSLFHSVIRVKKRTSDVFFIARVLCISEECDLALLTVDDDSFWTDVPSLTLGGLPALQDDVACVGYPISGENICITSGVTSRIEMRDGFVTVQIDAAVNPGNSGGPAFNVDGGDVVGIAFEKVDSSDNTGFLIGTDDAKHFLQDFDRNGQYTGLADCGFTWQTLADIDIRRYFKMKKEDSGVLIYRVGRKSLARGILKRDDVVMCVDGVDISNMGTFLHRCGERLTFDAMIAEKFPGDQLKLEVLRDGKKMEVSYKVKGSHDDDEIIPTYTREKKPEFFIFGGLVFVVLTHPYVNNRYRNAPAPTNIVNWLNKDFDDENVDHIVVLSKVLNDEVNVEYGHIMDQRVKKVNGTKIKSLVHMRDLIDKCKEEFLRFDLDHEIVVLDLEKALAAHAKIQAAHFISDMSRIYTN